VNGFEWIQKFACSQGDLEVNYHILDPESFNFFFVSCFCSNRSCVYGFKWDYIFLSSNCFSTECARPLKSESEVLKEVTGSTVWYCNYQVINF